MRATDKLGNYWKADNVVLGSFFFFKGHKNLEYILQQPLKVNLMNSPTSLWEMENNVHNMYKWKIDTECVCEWQDLEKEQS